MTCLVKFKKVDVNAHIPTYAHPGDSGMDLYSVEQVVVEGGSRYLISTGLIMELPEGYEAQIRPRSGLAIKNGITVLNAPGTIDNGYVGIIKVILINHSRCSHTVNIGDRIAQMVIAPVTRAECIEVSEIKDTERSSGGFGSTGLNTEIQDFKEAYRKDI